jgi:GntR family transcriptional regulator
VCAVYLYREVYSDIKKDILTNHYRAGKPMPTQDDLATKYATSRLTIKKALQLLKNEGLIFSTQGSGTYVRPRVMDSEDELMPLNAPIGAVYSHRDQKVTSKVLHFDARLPHQIEQQNLGIASSDPVYEIKRARFINGHHYSFEHTIMPTAIAPLNKEILEGSVYDYLGSHAKLQLADARRIVYADAADQETADALAIPVGSPILVIEQTAFDQKGRAFEYSISKFIHDHSRFVLDVHRELP